MSTYEQVRTITSQLSGSITVSDSSVETAVLASNALLTTIDASTSRSDGMGLTIRSDTDYNLTAVRMVGARNTGVVTYQSVSTAFIDAEVYIRDIAATTVRVASSAVSDTNAAGNGARSVRITGVNASLTAQTEDLNLAGRVSVESSNSYIAINSVEVLTAGPGRTNNGVISVVVSADDVDAAGVPEEPTRVFSQMAIGLGTAETPVYAIPTGRSFYPVSLSCTSGTAFIVQMRFTDLTVQTSPVDRSVLEVRCSGDSATDLRGLPPFTSGAVHILAKNPGATGADVTFVLAGYVDT